MQTEEKIIQECDESVTFKTNHRLAYNEGDPKFTKIRPDNVTASNKGKRVKMSESFQAAKAKCSPTSIGKTASDLFTDTSFTTEYKTKDKMQLQEALNFDDFKADVSTTITIDSKESVLSNNSKTSGTKSVHRFLCKHEGCGKSFSTRKELRRHKLTHRVRKYVCPVKGCGRAFYEKSKLKRHMVVHTKKKEYACPICGKKFGYKANVKTHMRTHTGEKPYKCRIPGCSKAFAQASNRNAHEKTHFKKLGEKHRMRIFSEDNDFTPAIGMKRKAEELTLDDLIEAAERKNKLKDSIESRFESKLSVDEEELGNDSEEEIHECDHEHDTDHNPHQTCQHTHHHNCQHTHHHNCQHTHHHNCDKQCAEHCGHNHPHFHYESENEHLNHKDLVDTNHITSHTQPQKLDMDVDPVHRTKNHELASNLRRSERIRSKSNSIGLPIDLFNTRPVLPPKEEPKEKQPFDFDNLVNDICKLGPISDVKQESQGLKCTLDPGNSLFKSFTSMNSGFFLDSEPNLSLNIDPISDQELLGLLGSNPFQEGSHANNLFLPPSKISSKDSTSLFGFEEHHSETDYTTSYMETSSKKSTKQNTVS